MSFYGISNFYKTRKNRKSEEKKRSVFLFFLISYILILLISMVSNILYYKRMENKMLENVKRTSLAMLEQLKIDIDNKLGVVSEISNNIVFDKKIEMLLKGSYSLFSYKDIMDDMMAQPKYDFIYDYYIYNRKNDEIITATIRLESELFYNSMYSYDDIDYDTWYDTVLSKYHFNTYLSSRQLNAYAGTEEHKVITFVQSIPVNVDRDILGQAIILIDQSRINEIIDKINWATEGYVYLIDKNGNIITTSKSAPNLSYDIKEKMDMSTDIIDYTQGKDNAVVLYHTSEETGWKYVIVMPESAFLAEINRDKIVTFMILISCFIIGIVFAYIFAYRSYQPIKEIKDMINRKKIIEKPQYRNEFDYIKSSIIDIFDNQHQMNSVITMQLPIIRFDFLTKLLKGYVRYADIDRETLRFMNIEFASDSFVVVLIEINSSSVFFASNTEKEWTLAKFVVQNIGSEMMENTYVQYFVEVETNMVAFIINFHPNVDAEYLLSDIKDLVANLANVLLDLCGLSVAFGISDVHNGIVELRECYDEALKALNYGLLIGIQDITFFNELAVKHDYYYYPIEMEVQLMNMLRTGNYKNVEEVIDTLFQINFKSRDTSLEAGRYFIIDILTTLIKVMNTIWAKNDEKFVLMDSVMDITGRYDKLDIIKKEVKKVAYDICDLVQKNHITPSEKLIADVEEYIKINYCENWISLSVIADNFEVTPQYLSTLFKKHRGENITDFISKLRVEKAKELLTSTDLTIAQISYQLGYANEMGVNRIFKKYEGITPGAYKQQGKI